MKSSAQVGETIDLIHSIFLLIWTCVGYENLKSNIVVSPVCFLLTLYEYPILTDAWFVVLAVVGWFIQEVYHLPNEIYSSSVPTEAFWKTLATGPMGQIVLWTSLFEIISTPAVIQMLQGSGREPGYFGFDPLGLGKNPDLYKRFQLSELKNGRLAMIAIGGLIHQVRICFRLPLSN